MRRLVLLLTVILLFSFICIPASAATSATGVRIDAVLDPDGSCQITLAATLHLDQAADLRFPLPANARGITLNGSGVSTRKGSGCVYVGLGSITGDARGDFTIVLRYTVPNTVTYNEDNKPQLDLPLLCGFAYPIERLDFSLTLPEKAKYDPTFTSGYHQASIEEDMSFQRSDNQITSSITKVLKDHETLSLTLRVTEKTFPRQVVDPWSAGAEDIGMFVMMGLALLYWLIFLRCAPFLRRKSYQPPEGCTAGELRCVLTGVGADLTMMVMSWAQLGYILIHLKESGRVTLYKRMEMGNERGAFERKVFAGLFGKNRYIDGSGYHYARLCRKVAASRGGLRHLFRRESGNPRFFRLLAAGAGVFGGASLAIALAGDAMLALLIILLISVVGGIASWLIQGWVEGLHLRGRGAMFLGLAVSAGWILLGGMAGEIGMAIGVVAFQLLTGLACAYGGRRTVAGRQMASRILGFRAYLKKMPREELDRIRRDDPDYFFTMVPYAMALGVDSAFAQQFGRKRMNPCSWLTTGMDGHMTAPEWTREIRRAATALDEHQKRLPWEQLLGKH